MLVQLGDLPRQPAQQHTEQHRQRKIGQQMMAGTPTAVRRQIQHPLTVGHFQVVLHGLFQGHIARGGRNHLHLAGIGMNAPQAVAIATRGQVIQPCRTQHIGKLDQHNREAPEAVFTALPVLEKHRQSPHRANPALHQRERSRQRHFAAIPCEHGFTVALGVGQQVMAENFFIAGERIDLPHHATRSQLQ